MPLSVLPLSLNNVLGLAGDWWLADQVSLLTLIMPGSTDCDIISTQDTDMQSSVPASPPPLSSLVLSTAGSRDWLIMFPLTRSSPYNVGGSSIL